MPMTSAGGAGSTTLTGPAPSKSGLSARDLLLRQDFILLGVFAVMVAFFTAMNSAFLTTFSIANILQDWAPVMLLAIGETYVIITGGIDLSVGSNLGISVVICAMTMSQMNSANDGPVATIAVGVVVALAVGVLVGLINGMLITRAKLAPFVATLATLGAGAGFTLVLTDGVQIAGGPREVITLGNTTYLQVLTSPLIVVIAVLAVTWIVLARTRFGRWTYSIGSNQFAARGAGINVQRHLLKVYVLSGLLAGLAGAFVYFRLGSGSPTSGQGQELAAIAATVIGGTSLFGGSGRMAGSLLGALITTSVLSGLILIGVAPNWQQVVIGVLIAVAVGIQQINVGRTRRGARHV